MYHINLGINMQTITVNQVHAPLPRSKRIDALGNDRYRVYFKEGNSTMLFCKGLTKPAVQVMIKRLKEHLAKLGTKLEGTFIITH